MTATTTAALATVVADALAGAGRTWTISVPAKPSSWSTLCELSSLPCPRPRLSTLPAWPLTSPVLPGSLSERLALTDRIKSAPLDLRESPP